jgi:hypothetical protein
MDEVLNEGCESGTTESVVYRSIAVPLFVEDENAEPKRNRVSARFDRSHYVPEYWHAFEPERSLSAPKNVNRSFTATKFNVDAEPEPAAEPKPARKKRPAPPKHSVESLSAVQMHGDYKLDRVHVREGGGLQVIAYCTGGHCDKTMRVFGPYHWLTSDESLCCPKCDRAKKIAKHRSMTNPTHGLYRFMSFEARSDKSHHSRVIAQCTGPRCGGKLRYFTHKAWQQSAEGLLGCILCSAPERIQRAQQSVQEFGTQAPLLDAAANDMRANEERRTA